VFMAISRRYAPKTFWRQNLHALARELLLLLPIVAAVCWTRRAGSSIAREFGSSGVR